MGPRPVTRALVSVIMAYSGVSRVLSRVVIYLGPALPPASSGQPGAVRRATAYAPYLALLRVGFAVPPMSPSGRCALTVPAPRRAGIPITRDTFSPLPRSLGAVSFLWHFP